MQLLARRRGLGALIYLVIRGFRNGDPTTIGITVAVVLCVIGYMIYSSRAEKRANESAEFARQYGPPNNDPNQQQ